MDWELLHPEVSDASEVLHLKLWEGSAFDYSLNGNDGTLVGTSLVYDYPGLNLAGSNEYIDTGNTFQSVWRSSYTISLWMKAVDGRPATMQYFLGADSGGTNRITMGLLSTGVIRIIQECGGVTKAHDADITVYTDSEDTGWQHIVSVGVEDVSISIYINGVFEGSRLVTPLDFSTYTSAITPYIGANNVDGSPDAGSYFAGKIDDVRILNRAFSAAEIRDFYEQTRWRYGV